MKGCVAKAVASTLSHFLFSLAHISLLVKVSFVHSYQSCHCVSVAQTPVHTSASSRFSLSVLVWGQVSLLRFKRMDDYDLQFELLLGPFWLILFL